MSSQAHDPDDRRSTGEVLDDIGHDIYHRVTRRLPGPDRGKSWPHAGDCEYIGIPGFNEREER